MARVNIYNTQELRSSGILCGKKGVPHIVRSKGMEVVVIGERNLRSASNRSRQDAHHAKRFVLHRKVFIWLI